MKDLTKGRQNNLINSMEIQWNQSTLILKSLAWLDLLGGLHWRNRCSFDSQEQVDDKLLYKEGSHNLKSSMIYPIEDRWLMEELNCIDNQLYLNRLYLQLTDLILWSVTWWRKLRKPQGLSLSTQRRLQKKMSFPGFMSKYFDVLGSS